MTAELTAARQQVKAELAMGFMHDLTLANRIDVVRNTFIGNDMGTLLAALARPATGRPARTAPADLPPDELEAEIAKELSGRTA